MRVAVITPFKTGNIGTIMQAYATQCLVEENGCSCDIINYTWDSIENPFLLGNLARRGLKSYLAAIAGHLSRLPKRKNLYRFMKRLHLTKPVKKSDLNLLEDEYNLFVAGSDCIWNAEAFEMETAYFLDFVSDNRKKRNYASSFAANTIPENLKADYRHYLKQFQKLSVREEQGRELIRDLTGQEATVVLDPTLVLNSKFWAKVAGESTYSIPDDYIFVAEYSYSKRMLEDAEKLAKKYSCKIVCAFPPKGKPIRAKVAMRAGPEDFMYLLKNAKYVLSDSYHMAIFSINFNKNFVSYFTNTNLPAFSKHLSIFTKLGLLDRIIDDTSKKKANGDVAAMKDINYQKVNPILEQERAVSRAYLAMMLGGNIEKQIE